MEAIESGDRASVSKVLEGLTPDERQRELTTACAGSGAGRSHGTDMSAPSARTSETVMLPVFHAAYVGHVDVFSEVHSALGANLPHDAVSLGNMSSRAGKPCTTGNVIVVLRSRIVAIHTLKRRTLLACVS